MSLWTVEKIYKAFRVDKRPPPQLTRKARAIRQYRRILRETRNWSISREYWIDRAVPIVRDEFERLRHLNNDLIIDKYLSFGDKWIHNHHHPSPYTMVWMENGSKWQRDDPFPHELEEEDRFFDFEEEIRTEYEYETQKQKLNPKWSVYNW